LFWVVRLLLIAWAAERHPLLDSAPAILKIWFCLGTAGNAGNGAAVGSGVIDRLWQIG